MRLLYFLVIKPRLTNQKETGLCRPLLAEGSVLESGSAPFAHWCADFNPYNCHKWVLIWLILNDWWCPPLRTWSPDLRSSRTPRSSSWCQWRRMTSPPSRPPRPWTSAPSTAYPSTANHKTFLPNTKTTDVRRRRAPACRSSRCSPSCTVRSHDRHQPHVSN